MSATMKYYILAIYCYNLGQPKAFFFVSVSRKFVATAAHCIITAKLKDTLVYLGELDTQDTGKVKELEPAELHRVSIIVHKTFLSN